MNYAVPYRIEHYDLWLAVYVISDGPDAEGYVMGHKLIGFGADRLAYVQPTMQTFEYLSDAKAFYKESLDDAEQELIRRTATLEYQLHEVKKLIGDYD